MMDFSEVVQGAPFPPESFIFTAGRAQGQRGSAYHRVRGSGAAVHGRLIRSEQIDWRGMRPGASMRAICRGPPRGQRPTVCAQRVPDQKLPGGCRVRRGAGRGIEPVSLARKLGRGIGHRGRANRHGKGRRLGTQEAQAGGSTLMSGDWRIRAPGAPDLRILIRT